eukprot:scaffold209542_cov53-Attheya_sp.AAC.1
MDPALSKRYIIGQRIRPGPMTLLIYMYLDGGADHDRVIILGVVTNHAAVLDLGSNIAQGKHLGD